MEGNGHDLKKKGIVSYSLKIMDCDMTHFTNVRASDSHFGLVGV